MPDHDDTDEQLPDARCFFLPLPFPLPVKDGSRFRVGDGEVKRAAPLNGLRASVTIHQTKMPSSPDALIMSRLLEFSHQRGNDAGDEADERESALLQQEVDLTVAEVVVPVPRDDPDAESPLDVAIAAVRQLQNATTFATQRAVPLLSRQRLPFMVPVFSQVLEADGTVTSDGPTLLAAVDTGAVERLVPSLSKTMSARDLEPALEQIGWGGPFILALEMRAEAQVHLRHHGDYRASVLSLAAAYEVQLDAVLMSMLWEEGKDPSSATHYFGINGMRHTQRVLSEYAPRLKGSWRKGHDAVGSYLKDVVNLRQRIMHTGYSPTECEAEAAHDASVRLEEYISARLRSPSIQKKYPRTAIMYCGPHRLDRDGDLTRVARDLLAARDEGWWFAQNERWADWASRYIDLDPPVPGSDPSELTVLMHYSKTDCHLLVVDARARAAAVPADSDAWLDPNGEQARILDELISHQRSQIGPEEWERAKLDVDVDPSLAAELTWQRDHELLPEYDHRLPGIRQHGPYLLPHETT